MRGADEYHTFLRDQVDAAIAELVDHYDEDLARYRELIAALANSNPVMEVEGTTICALCDTSEHYRHWPRHKDHCPWQQAKDLIESEEWG